MGGTLLGFIMLAWPMYLAQGIALRHVESLFFVVLVCKFGDIGGYLFGVAFGRHKLIPHISPGKTIQGSVGSLLVSCGMAVWLSPILLFQEVEKVTGNGDPIVGGVDVTLGGAILIGVMLNCTAQIGDLVESLLKPSAKIAQGFDTYVFATTEGKVVSGFVSRESAREVEVRQINGLPVLCPRRRSRSGSSRRRRWSRSAS